MLRPLLNGTPPALHQVLLSCLFFKSGRKSGRRGAAVAGRTTDHHNDNKRFQRMTPRERRAALFLRARRGCARATNAPSWLGINGVQAARGDRKRAYLRCAQQRAKPVQAA